MLTVIAISLLVARGACIRKDRWLASPGLGRLLRLPHECRAAHRLRSDRVRYPRHHRKKPRHITADTRGVSLPHYLCRSRERLRRTHTSFHSDTSLQRTCCLDFTCDCALRAECRPTGAVHAVKCATRRCRDTSRRVTERQFRCISGAYLCYSVK